MQETINLVKNVLDNFNKRAQLSLDEAIQLYNLHGRLQQEYNALAGQRDEAIRMLEEANKSKGDISKKKATVEQSLDALK